MKYEDIKTANEKLTPIDIKGKNYIDVAQRIQAFRSIEPSGAIITELVADVDGEATFKATVYDGEGKILATGYAKEKETSSYINKTSYIENCETSAVGRALGFIGLGSENSIASLEEVANAINNQQAKPKTDEYEKALDVTYQGRTLRDWYKNDRAMIKEIYDYCSQDVKKAISIIERRIKEGK